LEPLGQSPVSGPIIFSPFARTASTSPHAKPLAIQVGHWTSDGFVDSILVSFCVVSALIFVGDDWVVEGWVVGAVVGASVGGESVVSDSVGEAVVSNVVGASLKASIIHAVVGVSEGDDVASDCGTEIGASVVEVSFGISISCGTSAVTAIGDVIKSEMEASIDAAGVKFSSAIGIGPSLGLQHANFSPFNSV